MRAKKRIEFETNPWTVLQGDCRDLMAQIPGNSVDSIVCDPPY